MRNIVVEDMKQTPLERQRLEIVERKGLGHPDYICDAVMDQISIRLSKEYLEKAGVILHHNVDKSLLVAGEAEPRFGGGIVKQPILFIFGDRATSEVNGEKIDVEEIAVNVAKEWFRKNMRFVDPDQNRENSSENRTVSKLKRVQATFSRIRRRHKSHGFQKQQ